MTAITFTRPDKPRVRTLCVLLAALAAVAAAPVLQVFGALDAGTFADEGDQTLRAAGYAFSIWGLIYFGLVAYGIWQMLRQTPETEALAAVGWPSVVAMAGCALWLVAAGFDIKPATVAIIVVSAAAAIRGLLRAVPHWGPLGPASRFFIFWPLGLLAGWLTIASAINILTVLTAYGLITPETARPAAFAGIAAVLLVGAAVVWRMHHLAYALPIAWGLVAVYVAERADKPDVAWAALAAAGLMLVVGGVAGWPMRRRPQAA